ncbi:MAG: flagellar protein FlgN [Peptococcaceae bacterium]|nr:flagellar protein FlgN [Peptococcaceae bacterium]
MAEILRNFENNLKKQIEFYKKITSLEREKQQALVENEIQEIEAITAQEEKILLEVSRLEEERLHWAEFFGKEMSKRAEEITLGELEQRYPTLQTVRKELETEINGLKALHETNTKLLENAVNLINFTISSLTSERHNTYANPAEKVAKKEGNSKISFIDKSV